MSIVIAQVQRANHGRQFHGYGLRTQESLISPILGVDHYWMNAPTFPPHRHQGMSAVSYLLEDSETGMANRDSIGTQNLIQAGGLHWTTAGRGVSHEEVPAEVGKTVHGLQFFVDLSESNSQIEPSPLILEAQDVPVIHLSNAKVRVPLGSYGDVHSPMNPPTEVTMLDISLQDGAEITVPIAIGHNMFAMPIAGMFEVEGQKFNPESLKLPVFPARKVSRDMTFKAIQGNAHIVLFSGPPLFA